MASCEDSLKTFAADINVRNDVQLSPDYICNNCNLTDADKQFTAINCNDLNLFHSTGISLYLQEKGCNQVCLFVFNCIIFINTKYQSVDGRNICKNE